MKKKPHWIVGCSRCASPSGSGIWKWWFALAPLITQNLHHGWYGVCVKSCRFLSLSLGWGGTETGPASCCNDLYWSWAASVMSSLDQTSFKCCLMSCYASFEHAAFRSSLKHSIPPANITQQLDSRTCCHHQTIMNCQCVHIEFPHNFWHRNWNSSPVSTSHASGSCPPFSSGRTAGTRGPLEAAAAGGSSRKPVTSTSSCPNTTSPDSSTTTSPKSSSVWGSTPSKVKDSRSSSNPLVKRNFSIIQQGLRISGKMRVNSATVQSLTSSNFLITAVLYGQKSQTCPGPMKFLIKVLRNGVPSAVVSLTSHWNCCRPDTFRKKANIWTTVQNKK